MNLAPDLPLAVQPAPVKGQMRNLVKDFVAFARKPTRRHPRCAGVRTQASAIFILMALNAMFTAFVCVPVMLVLNRTLGLDTIPRLQSGAFMFSAVALAPLMEELMFRAGLRSPHWALFGMPAVIAAMFLGWRTALCSALVLGLAWLMDYRHRQRLSGQALTQLRWKRGRQFIRHYALVVHFYAVLFACVHFSNFTMDGGSGWKNAFFILAVMSQLMTGLTCSYLRLRYGLGSSMAAHFSWNACAVGLALAGF